MDAQHMGRKQDALDAEPGFKVGLGGLPGGLPGSAGGWAPGQEPMLLPEGYGIEWAKGADLLLQLHLKSSGKPEKEQSRVGIYLTSEPPRFRLQTAPIVQWKIDLQPGDANYKVTQRFNLPANADVYGVVPHMHLLGRQIKAVVRRPDGTVEPLIWIKDWDFNWQMYYQYAQPLHFPAGSVVEAEWIFDNSTANVRNPNSPPKPVHFGEQTADEMALLFLTLCTKVAPPAPSKPSTPANPAKPANPADPAAAEAALFHRLDKDGNQKLSAQELTATGATLEMAKKWVQTFDRDGDGELNPLEAAALRAGK
jgi:hypothetical protein